MIDICDSIDTSIASKNWYAALIVALTLPDICGSIEYPGLKGENVNGIYVNRYAEWFDNFVGEKYKVYRELDPSSPTYQPTLEILQEYGHHLEQLSEYRYVETFLNGFECYVLRCKYLHEGLDRISEDTAKDVLNGFMFVAPLGNNISIHNNLGALDGNTVVQLQVDIFSRDISNAAKVWWDARIDKEAYAKSFLKIDRMLT